MDPGNVWAFPEHIPLLFSLGGGAAGEENVIDCFAKLLCKDLKDARSSRVVHLHCQPGGI